MHSNVCPSGGSYGLTFRRAMVEKMMVGWGAMSGRVPHTKVISAIVRQPAEGMTPDLALMHSILDYS